MGSKTVVKVWLCSRTSNKRELYGGFCVGGGSEATVGRGGLTRRVDPSLKANEKATEKGTNELVRDSSHLFGRLFREEAIWSMKFF